MFKILSLDGGGIRGVIPAIWLEEIEKSLKEKTGKPLYKHFDLIAGTSTGSILAAAVAYDISLQEVVDLYKNKGRKIFPNHAFANLTGARKPKYDPKPFEQTLQEVLGSSRKLEEAKTKLLITSYDVFLRKAFFFRSYSPRTKKVETWKACRASSAAPGYFPLFDISVGNAEYSFIDGGVFANNPSTCALAEAIELTKSRDLSNILFISLGTGRLPQRIKPNDAKNWGLLRWGLPIIDILFDSSSETDGFICEKLLDKNYVRMQIELNGISGSLDDARKENIDNLCRIAEGYISDGEGKKHIDKIVEYIGNEQTL
jgi:patatin-like phospholipase/acyl hydrolase